MSDDQNKSSSSAILSGLGVLADLAGVAALVFASGIEWVAFAGAGAMVFGLVALAMAVKQGRMALAALAALVLVASGGLLAYGFLNPPDETPAAAPAASSAPPAADEPSATPSTEPETTTPETTSAVAWYNLSAYESVDYGNGHDSVGSISIGGEDFADSIRGYYSSSAAKPDNRRTWLLGGKCTQLSVWVGKDAGSRKSAGTGRFIVKNGDAEIATAEATIDDAPQHLEVDVTGVVRLTLLDTRGRDDANNAWGTPRVSCTEPPGEAR